MVFKYDEFLICTVREADANDLRFLENYVAEAEASGRKVYYPAKDTNQIDETGGYQICCDNNLAMRESQEVSVYWTTKSQGTKFDLGMAFNQHRTENKKIKLANRSDVEKMVQEQRAKGLAKSFEMVLLRLDDLAKE
ncbi:hypothetical protein H8D36_06890 [archaeon]|nr:hypothetical protein [archaeon]